jgi:hypothetical protein
MKNQKPIMAPRKRSRAAYAPERSRLRKRRSGMMGCSARRSFRTKNASSTTPTASAASVRASVQPASAERTIP